MRSVNNPSQWDRLSEEASRLLSVHVFICLVYVSVTGRTPAESKDVVNEAPQIMYCSGCH